MDGRLTRGNKIVSGEWFNQSSDGVSISIEIAERYNLKLNDKIEIDVAGKRISSFIQSIREVNWENFSPNFFAIVIQMTFLTYLLHTSLLFMFLKIKK